jgi:hypothetical protein
MSFDPRDPDAALVAVFKITTGKNAARSLTEGRPIYDDYEVCEIRKPGKIDTGVCPATAISHWVDNEDGEKVAVTYAERFSRQYQQFKAKLTQTKAGTPLDEVPFLTSARRAELRAMNVYTLETLADMDGLPLKNLGLDGRDLKNKAVEYIAASRANAPNMVVLAELEALKARARVLEEDNAMLKASKELLKEPKNGDSRFDDMSNEQLRDYITTNTGHEPKGLLNRRSLIAMAANLVAAAPAG